MPGKNIRRAFPRHCGIKSSRDYKIQKRFGIMQSKTRRERWRGEPTPGTSRTLWKLNSYDRMKWFFPMSFALRATTVRNAIR